jgi:ATP-binding cassette subfamily F protein 3
MEDLDVSDPEMASHMEELAETISQLEDELAETNAASEVQRQAAEALAFMGINGNTSRLPLQQLTEGQRNKVYLAMVMLACCSASCDLLLLDEPTNSLDVPGLLQLRQVVESVTTPSASSAGQRRPTTVLLVSHDCDFINDVATDVIEFSQHCTLVYYAGNYADYQIQREQLERHQERQAAVMGKKQEAMQQTLDNLKKQPVPKRGGTKKKSRTITSHKKKMDRLLLGDTDNGAGPSVHARRKRIDDEPDKTIQFRFRNCGIQWNEPLVLAMDVGHGYEMSGTSSNDPQNPPAPSDSRGFPLVAKKTGYLFDCVDLCIQEGVIYCILGENASGKSTLLKILANLLPPVEGKIAHALNVSVAFLEQSHVHSILDCKAGASSLSYLSEKLPNKTEQEIRGELTAFGLSPKQAATDVRFLSGGERCRLCMAKMMLQNHLQVLCLDDPTANLDVESVEALIYGLKHWNGTTIMVSHDAYFLRSVEAQCYVLIPEEGKLRRVEGGVDAYLRSFGTRR